MDGLLLVQESGAEGRIHLLADDDGWDVTNCGESSPIPGGDWPRANIESGWPIPLARVCDECFVMAGQLARKVQRG